jgi:hypothetical protein
MTIQCSGINKKNGERCSRKIIPKTHQERISGIIYCKPHKGQQLHTPPFNQEAKETKEINRFDCECCYSKCLNSEKCACTNNHQFCNSCLRRYIEEKTVGGGEVRLKCMSIDECKGNFSETIIASVLSKPALDTWNSRVAQQELSLAKVNDLRTCPKCRFFAVIIEEQDYKMLGNLLDCKNPKCGYKSCLLCQNLYASCAISGCDKGGFQGGVPPIRKIVEEILSNSRIRKCPCGIEFVRIDGCSKMTCSSCKRISCYICQKQAVDYSHFSNLSPSSIVTDPVILKKCPLYLNESEVEKQCVKNAIRKVFEKYSDSDSKTLIEAKSVLIQLNPDQTTNIENVFRRVIEIVIKKEQQQTSSQQTSSQQNNPQQQRKNTIWTTGTFGRFFRF